MNPQSLRDLCAQGVALAKRAGAQQAEVYAQRTDQLEASFLAGDLDQVCSSAETLFGLRVIVDGRIGFATSNQPDHLAATAEAAVAWARSSPPDPLAGLPDPLPLPDLRPQVDPEILALGPDALVARGLDLLGRIEARDRRVKIDRAVVNRSEGQIAVVSSTGVDAAWHSAQLSGDVFGMAVDGAEVGSFSYDADATQRLVEADALFAQMVTAFADRCVGALGATRGESFCGTLWIPPHAVEEVLLDMLLTGANAGTVRRGTSPLADKLGRAIASAGLTLTEAGPGLPWYPLCPFDREGIPRQRTAIVENGVLRSFLYDALEARAVGRASTGHAVGGATSLPGVGVTSLCVDTGDMADEAWAQMKRGVVVTRFSGTTDPASGDFSGVVKGGFLIRDGDKRPIHETTISGNLWTLLHQISGIGQTAHRVSAVRALPAIRVEDVDITAG
jgi:PmbA protein